MQIKQKKMNNFFLDHLNNKFNQIKKNFFFRFLTNRKRSDDPENRGEFVKRDSREIGVGMSESIALADETLSNNNLTIPQLIDSAYKIIKGWIK